MSSTSPDLEFDPGARAPGSWTIVFCLVLAHGLTAVVYAERAGMGWVSALFLERSVQMRVVAGGQYGPLVWDGQIWRLVRSVGLHADALHLLVNCVAIVVLGRLIEPWVGSIRVAWWFTLAGVVGSVASQLAGLTQSDGASGGAFGLLGALIVLGWRHRDQIIEADRPIVTRWLPVFLVLNIVLSLVLPFVDAVGHLGGLGAGLALGALAQPHPPSRRVQLVEGFGVAMWVLIAISGPLWIL